MEATTPHATPGQLYQYPESGLEHYEPDPGQGFKSNAYPEVMLPPTQSSPVYTQTTSVHEPANQETQSGKEDTRTNSRKEATICGMRRTNFWIAVVAVVATVTIAVLAGLLGAALNGGLKSASNSSATASQTTTTATKPSTTSSATATPTIVTAIGPGGVTLQCPSADGLNYTSPGTKKVFKRLCNFDFAGSDLFNVTVMNFEACMDACAARSDCLAATWDYNGPQGTGNSYCWIKNTQPSKSASQNHESAYLLDT